VTSVDGGKAPTDLVLTERHGATLLVTLNKPSKLNALTPAVAGQLIQAWEEATDRSIRSVVLTGAGRGFCAGVDLRPEPAELLDPLKGRQRYGYNPMVLKVASLDKPVIGAINGAAAGAGLGLACSTDLRIAAKTARFVPAFIKIGSTPDMGSSFHLTRILGYERALQWLLTNEPMEAEEALEAGLVQQVTEPENLLDAALALCEALTVGPSTAVGLTKQLLRNSHGSSLAEHLEREVQIQMMAAADPAAAEARAKHAQGFVK
jgi:2-(1,2-epoxy-1,2-dihydrophenyl)acetyl-CoA isomerase